MDRDCASRETYRETYLLVQKYVMMALQSGQSLRGMGSLTNAAVVRKLKYKVHFLVLLLVDYIIQLDYVDMFQSLQAVDLSLQVLLPITCLSKHVRGHPIHSCIHIFNIKSACACLWSDNTIPGIRDLMNLITQTIPFNTRAHILPISSHLAEQFFAYDFYSDSLPEFGVTFLHPQPFTYLAISTYRCSRIRICNISHVKTEHWFIFMVIPRKARRHRHLSSRNYAIQEWNEQLKIVKRVLCCARVETSCKLLLCPLDIPRRRCETKSLECFWNFQLSLQQKLA